MTREQSTAARPTAFSHGVAPYAMRMLLGCAGLAYFHQAATVTGFLPLPLQGVLGLVGGYVAANAVLLVRSRALTAFTVDLTTVLLDLLMLLVIVLQDPYRASPVTILLLSTVFDYGQRLRRALFSGATALVFLILVFNAWARLGSTRFALPSEGIWLSSAIGALMANFYAMALAADKVRTERRRLSTENEALRQREREEVEAQLRMARVADSLRFTGLPREEFADKALHALVGEFGACAAALYEPIEDSAGPGLRPLATYAVDLPRLRRQRFALGEGPMGACALGRKLIELHQVPEEYFEIASALGRSAPQHLYLMPLSFHAQLAGVMELALVQPLAARELNLLQQIAEVFAAGLLVAERSHPQKTGRDTGS